MFESIYFFCQHREYTRCQLLNRTGIGSDSGPEVGALFGHRAGDGRTLHLSLVVDDNSGIIFEVYEDPVLPPEGLPLPDHHCGHHLLSEFRLSFLDGGHDHIATSGGRQSIQPAFDAVNSDHIQILGPSVVGTVDDSTHRQTKRYAKLRACGSSTSLRHQKRETLGLL